MAASVILALDLEQLVAESDEVWMGEVVARHSSYDAQGRIVVIGDAPDRPGEIPRIFSRAREFRDSAPSDDLPRAVSAIFTQSRHPGGDVFYRDLAAAGGGDYVDHQGRIMESVLLSILEPTGAR